MLYSYFQKVFDVQVVSHQVQVFVELVRTDLIDEHVQVC